MPTEKANIMEIKTLTSASTLCVTIRGRLDSDSAEFFVSRLLADFVADLRNMELDCANLDYLGSDGLFAIVTLYDAVGERNGRFCLKHVKAQVAEALKVSGLDTVIHIS